MRNRCLVVFNVIGYFDKNMIATNATTVTHRKCRLKSMLYHIHIETVINIPRNEVLVYQVLYPAFLSIIYEIIVRQAKHNAELQQVYLGIKVTG